MCHKIRKTKIKTKSKQEKKTNNFLKTMKKNRTEDEHDNNKETEKDFFILSNIKMNMKHDRPAVSNQLPCVTLRVLDTIERVSELS